MGDNIRDPKLGFIQPVKASRDRTVLDAMVAVAGWAVLGNDTTTLAINDNNILGDKSLSFDKVDGAAGTVFAGIEKTINAVSLKEFLASDKLVSAFFAAALTNVVNIFFRVGTDSSNYSVFKVLVASLTANVWNPLALLFTDADVANQVGAGHDLDVITYIAVGVEFTLETNALAGLHFDHLHIEAADN